MKNRLLALPILLAAAACTRTNRVGAKTLRYLFSAPVAPIRMGKLRGPASCLPCGLYPESRDTMKMLDERLPDEWRLSAAGRKIDGFLHPRPTVGPDDRMVDGELCDAAGHPRSLSKFAARYRERGIPHFVLIAPDGTIPDAWFGYGMGSLETKLERNIR